MKRLLPILFLICNTACAQWSPYGLGLIQQPNALSARHYLGVIAITNGSGVVFTYNSANGIYTVSASGGGGSGTVTNFQIGNMSPLFTTSVANPTTFPSVTFTPVGTGSSGDYYGGDNAFHALPAAGSGTVTNFASGNLFPLFGTVVANPTTFPALSFTQVLQSANLVFAGPTTGVPAAPTFRSLVAADMPAAALGGIETNNGSGTNNIFTTATFEGTTTFHGDLEVSTNNLLHVHSITAEGSGASLGIIGISGDILNAHGAKILLHTTLAGSALFGGNNDARFVTVSNGPSQIFDLAGTNWISVDQTGVFIKTNGGAGASLVAFDSNDNVTRLRIGTNLVSDGTTLSATGGTGTSVDVSSNNVVTGTPTNIHFWVSGTLTQSQTNRGNGNIDVAFGNPFNGVNGIDRAYQILNPYDSGTNFYIDFTNQAWVINATGAMAFRYSTNWPTSTTNRITHIFIPPTNYVRTIYVYDDATNWTTAGLVSITTLPGGTGARLSADIWGQGETNAVVIYIPGSKQTFNSEVIFSPPSVAGLFAWYDGDSLVWSNNIGTVPVTVDGTQVQRWGDISMNSNDATNNLTTIVWSQFGAPNNHGSIKWPVGTTSTYLVASNIATRSQPIYAFVVAKAQLLSNARTIFWSGTNGTAQLEMGANWTATPGMDMGNANSFAKSTSTNGLQGNWAMYTFQCDGVNSVIRTNGQAGITVTTGSVGVKQLVLGSLSIANTSTSWQGDIAEMIFYAANLSGANVTNIERYLAAKYSLSGP